MIGGADIQANPFDQEEQEVDRFFCPSRIPRTAKAKAFVEKAIDILDQNEKADLRRKRRRKAKDQQTYISTVTAVVCDLAHYILSDDHRSMVISRSKEELGKANRYKHPAMNQGLPKLLDAMSGEGLLWLEQRRGYHYKGGAKQKTTINAREAFHELVAKHGLTCDDFGHDRVRELIELKDFKKGYGKKPKNIPYTDTEQTCRYRTQVQAINEYLEGADIEFDRRALRRFITVDTSLRRLRRSFTCGSFSSGGRMWDGFWMNLGKEERLRGLKINGERIVGVDYKSSAIRILYGITGKTPPRDDLYEIKCIDPKWREGIKRLYNTLTFSDVIPSKKPRETTQLLPKTNVKNLCQFIIDSHPDIAHHLPSQIGHRIQFIESEMIIRVVSILIGEGIVSLPIHDCVLVPESAREITVSVMLSVFYDMVGIEGSVSIDDISSINKSLYTFGHTTV
ncbi:hypothetical protein [Methylobacterium iners]|uniref:Uncharacterized protein n=1 Tax=Methylobacterium iners TaxID=418707 RepID=A0ABQ4RSF0_9HYPH|nr:hypothetical protein [Methylobacterium iners]GJD93088.1 hypothetical protein OCOJLMKI_0275 [Methylobacterium iners]